MNILELIKKYGTIITCEETGLKTISFTSKIKDNFGIKYKNDVHIGFYEKRDSNTVQEILRIGKGIGKATENRFSDYDTNVMISKIAKHPNAEWIGLHLYFENHDDMEHRIFLRKYKNIEYISGTLLINNELVELDEYFKNGEELIKYLDEILEPESTNDGYFFPTKSYLKEKIKETEENIEFLLKEMSDKEDIFVRKKEIKPNTYLKFSKIFFFLGTISLALVLSDCMIILSVIGTTENYEDYTRNCDNLLSDPYKIPSLIIAIIFYILSLFCYYKYYVKKNE